MHMHQTSILLLLILVPGRAVYNKRNSSGRFHCWYTGRCAFWPISLRDDCGNASMSGTRGCNEFTREALCCEHHTHTTPITPPSPPPPMVRRAWQFWATPPPYNASCDMDMSWNADWRPPDGWHLPPVPLEVGRVVLSVAIYQTFADGYISHTLALTSPTTPIVVHTSNTSAPYGSVMGKWIRESSFTTTTTPRVIHNPTHIATRFGTGTVILAHWSNFWLADKWVTNFTHFVLLAENSFIVKPDFETYVRATNLIDIERSFRIADRPHRNKTERLKVKPCAMGHNYWLNHMLGSQNENARAAKGMHECSFFPRMVLKPLMCEMGATGGFAALLEKHKSSCFAEEHWHPTWILNHVDWTSWRNQTLSARKIRDDGASAAGKPFEGMPPHTGSTNWFKEAPQVDNSSSLQGTLWRCWKVLQDYRNSSIGMPLEGKASTLQDASPRLMMEALDVWRKCVLLERFQTFPSEGVYCLKDSELRVRLHAVDTVDSMLDAGG